MLPIHATFAATALLIGPLQFITALRYERPLLHRAIGVTYVICCFVGGATGLPLALASTAGPVAAAGFASLGILWITITGIGLVLATQGRCDAHRKWMIRSYALTFAAVTLRLYLPFPPLMGIDFVEVYRVI
jgi:uncharacterized membrane protein